jgi:3'(2'), 5'-bisphosphate nucleotidase
MDAERVIWAMQASLPPVMRWCGAVARRLRQFNIAVDGKHSGNANTDALTLADLTVQELLVAALRDGDPILRTCCIEGEEATGDMQRFSPDSSLSIAIDPIDGTKQYRDRTGNGYSIIVHLHDETTPLYSLVFCPEMSEHGTWVEVVGQRIACGPDHPDRTARETLDRLPDLNAQPVPRGTGIYLIGFQQHDAARAREVDRLSVHGRALQGRTSDEMPGSIYPFMATGEYAGSLIHSPNIYDFPVSMHLARVRGGDAVQVHDLRPVTYRQLWMDQRAGMLRFPAVVACSHHPEVMQELCGLSRDWSQKRYAD